MRAQCLLPTVFLAVLCSTLAVSSAGAADSGADLVDSVTVYNVAAHLDDLMSLPAAARWATAAPGKKPLFDMDPKEIRSTIAASRGYWPEEVELAVPASAFPELDGLVRLAMLGSLCKGAREAGAAGKRDGIRLQKDLLRQLRALRVPRMVLRARFHEEAMGSLVGRMIMVSLRQSLAELHIRPIDRPNGLGLRLPLGTLLEGNAIPSALAELGWIAGARDPQARPLAKALAAVPLEMWLEIRGADLVLSLGPAWTGGPAALQPPPTSVAATARLLGLRWEAVRLGKLVKGWLELWSAYANTPTGHHTRVDDDLDLFGDLEMMPRWLASSGESGTMWLWVERGIRGWAEEQHPPTAAPLGAVGLGALLPASLIAFDADSRLSLGERLSERVQQLESRMSLRSWRDGLEEGGPNETREKAYYRHFTRFRELIHRHGPTLFEGGSALVLGKGARLGSVEVRRQGRQPVKRDDLAVPEMAMIGQAKDPQAALQFASEAWAAVAGGFAEPLSATRGAPTSGGHSPPAPEGIPDAKVQFLDTSWIERAGGAEISTTTPRGFKPHVAVRGNAVVLSTSLSLTEEILRGGKNRLELPTTKDPLLSWTLVPCAPMARQLRGWIVTWTKLFGPSAPNSRSLAKYDQLATAADLVCSETGGLTSLTTQAQGGPRTTHIDMPAGSVRR